MTSISALNHIHKKGLFGNHENKKEENLIKVSEIKNMIIVQIVQYKNSTVSIKKIDIDSLKFDAYEFNSSEDKVLLQVESEPIYRYSEKSFVYAYDLKSNNLIKISDKKISLPEFSPNGKMISYVYNNNLFIYDIISKETTKCTKDGKKNKIIYWQRNI